jgi:hypothetical protein
VGDFSRLVSHFVPLDCVVSDTIVILLFKCSVSFILNACSLVVEGFYVCCSYCLGSSFQGTFLLVTALRSCMSSLNGLDHLFDQFSIVLSLNALFCGLLLGLLTFIFRDLILVQHQYNNCTTTPHMRVGPSERLLYWCCKSNIFLIFIAHVIISPFPFP